jgi:hypothetical protein
VGQVVFVAATGVVAVGVGEHGPRHRAMRVNVHVGGRAVQAFGGIFEKVRQNGFSLQVVRCSQVNASGFNIRYALFKFRSQPFWVAGRKIVRTVRKKNNIRRKKIREAGN